MRRTAEKIAQQLDAMADAYAMLPTAEVGPWRQLSLTLSADGCTFKIKIFEEPAAFRSRAEYLRKKARGFGNGLTDNADEQRRAAKWKPNMRRPKSYNKTTAQQFLDDGERDNWQAYRDLFDD